GSVALFAVGALVASVAGTALAGGNQTSGTGKSHLGFTVGYVAKQELSGSFEYQPTFIDGTSVNIHCGQTDGLPDYTSYTQTTTNKGFPKSIFNSTYCWDRSGTRYFVHVEAVDMGEPGVLMGDTLCITVKLFPGRLNPTPLIKDCGVIQDGNVQILPNNPG